MNMTTYKVALIPGDGIGRDMVAAAWVVLQKAAGPHGFGLEGTDFPWSCAFYK
jgi:tartrate dehydrogenase/decarboxylase/D-malate dehydrogenase